MLCRKPRMVGAALVPCNWCRPCRIKRQNEWITRLKLEMRDHEHAVFVTLTYNDLALTDIDGGRITDKGHATLVPNDVTLFLKRLRKMMEPTKLRYYVSGDYSPWRADGKGMRPHYHGIFFGVRPCAYINTRKHEMLNGRPCCPTCDMLTKAWQHGNVFVGTVTPQSMRYSLKYVSDKMVGNMDTHYDGRYPHYAVMSMRPGIGYKSVSETAQGMRGMELRGQTLEDAPTFLREGKTPMPLNQLYRRKVRENLGKAPTAPEHISHERSMDLLPVQALASSLNTSVAKLQAEATEQQALNMVTKMDIFKTRKKL